jgi:pilus assembly protein CpaC
VRARVGKSIACLSAFTFAICTGSLLQGQAVTQPAPAPQTPGVSTQDSANELTVAVGKSVLVDVAHPIERVAVGLGDFALASAVTPTEILLNGKTQGETSLIIWEVGGEREFFNVSVRAVSALSNDRLEDLRRELREELPEQTLKISAENGNIFLRGTVKDLGSADRAVQIASTAGKVVNLLDVAVPPSDPQILLKVRFASVDRSLEKQFGINFFSTGFGNVVSGVNTGEYSPPGLSLPSSGTASTATLSNDLNLFAYLPGLNLGATLQALESKGIVQVLAEPNVMAINGKQASFLAGGEYPYPVVQGTSTGGAGSVSIQFKEYGVRLNFVPTITPRGTIRLQVAPEVSSLDFTNSIEIAGFDVPAIDTRKMKTEVELADGQSFAISGLLDNRDTETYEKIPFLGDIPILGKLFQSMQKTRTNTELIVIVTPEIVTPIPAGAPLPELKYPTKFLPPNTGIPMNTPDAKTAANTLAPAPTAMPVQQLIDSLKPETPLVVDSSTATFGSGSGSGGSSASQNTPAPVTTAPQ